MEYKRNKAVLHPLKGDCRVNHSRLRRPTKLSQGLCGLAHYLPVRTNISRLSRVMLKVEAIVIHQKELCGSVDQSYFLSHKTCLYSRLQLQVLAFVELARC